MCGDNFVGKGGINMNENIRILLVEDDALEKAIEAGFKADHISVGLAL